MDIRTKLVFALVAVALGGMLALGAVAYTTVDQILKENSLRHLEALAESKKQDLETVLQGWRDRVSLIASRTQLRLSLNDFNRTGSPEERERIQRILRDANRAARTVGRLTVYDVAGHAVGSTGVGQPEEQLDLDPSRLLAGEEPAYEGVSYDEEAGLQVSYVAALLLEGAPVGVLHVLLSGEDLAEVTQNFIGLGQTGETLVVLPVGAAGVRLLRSERPRAEGGAGVVRLQPLDAPAELAMAGREAVYSTDLIDYRGQPVWAATRFLPEVGWGLVVKFDAAEERAPIVQFRRDLSRLGLSLSAFAILLGIALGFRFAKPILDLAGVANRVRAGELDARARTGRQDEIGLLARTFNQMAEELEQKVELLHEFEKFFDMSLDMLVIAGTDGYFKRVNPAWERTLGWSSDELVNRPFFDFVHPDDIETTLREVEKLSQGIPTVSFENRYRCADGSYKHLLWTSFPEEDTGLLYAVARDITGFKNQQQEQNSAGELDTSQSG